MTAVIGLAISARETLMLDLDLLEWSAVATFVTSASDVVRRYLEALVRFISVNWRHFRKQVQALEKMIDRKDELIARFNQHRRDKLKRDPARLRECIYKPVL